MQNEKHGKVNFELVYIVMNPGYNDKNLNKTEESNVTDIIPLPLNNGNIITDGMLEARYVITRLMTQRETAEPNPHITYFMEILQCKNPFFENIVNNKNAQANE